jgi:hypothetical protein
MLLATVSEGSGASKLMFEAEGDIHLVIEDLGLARLSLRDQRLI